MELGGETPVKARAGLIAALWVGMVVVSFAFVQAAGSGSIPGASAEFPSGLEFPDSSGKFLYREPFMLGLYSPAANHGYLPPDLCDAERELGAKLRIVSFYQAWGPKSLDAFPGAIVEAVGRRGAMPMISWGPWTSTFPAFQSDPDLHHDRRIFHAIIQGRLDGYICAYARRLRDFHKPILLRFAHEPENPGYPWSAAGGNSAEEYVAGWRHVVDLFRKEGASNVMFVWNPWHPEQALRYFPGGTYIDWFGLTLLNYGGAYRNGKWCSFEELYEPFRRQFARTGAAKPTILAEFGTTAYGGSRGQWLKAAMESIAVGHPEIRAVVFFHTDCDPNWPTRWRPPGNPRCIDWTFLHDSAAVTAVRTAINRPGFHQTTPITPARSRSESTSIDAGCESANPQ